ncbi:MAG: rhodanese-like domain-containing protein [Wenzhouxiangella sp.]|nr:rhodanese-like domain-containing protein [Wenzhouxiangella sp.]MDR9452532.1 rhodanese-like domain-containing protein [Wenzhouxiangella sp.]
MMLLSAYQFIDLDGLPLKQADFRAEAKRLGLIGTVVIAHEGINFSVGGPRPQLDAWQAYLAAEHGIDQLVTNFQPVDSVPFLRLRVRIRPEIITFDPNIQPHHTGTADHVDPATWHALIQDPNVQLVDTRNDNECQVGSFVGAQNPKIEKFSEFGEWATGHLDPARPVAMFCTGGVRCEKAGSHLKAHGFGEVYQLEGGILSYLQQMDPDQSLWDGECFVFDDRIAVDHALKPTDQGICAGCRNPVDGLDANNLPPWDEAGQCQICHQQFCDDKMAGIKERVRQMALARERGQRHLGPQGDDQSA